MLAVASGTKMKLIATPLKIVGQTMLLIVVLKLIRPKRNEDTPGRETRS